MKQLLILLLLFFSYIPFAFAHGGEEHGDNPAATAVTATRSAVMPATPVTILREVNSKQGQFKFNIIQTPSDVHQDQEVKFDIQVKEVVEGSFEGETTVENAMLKAEIREENSSPVPVDIQQNKELGSYGFSFVFLKGANFQLTLNMVTDDNRKASVEFPVTVIGKPVNYKIYALDALILVLIILAIFLFYRRASKNPPGDKAVRQTALFSVVGLVIFTISFILLPKLLPENTPQILENTEVKETSDNLVQIPKGTQLLFNIRTQEAEEHKIISGLTVTGTVKTPPQSKADIISPVAGRVQISNVTVGSYVRKGQTIAVVEQILSIPETAAIQATLADIRSKVTDLQSKIEPARDRLKASQAEYERSKIDLKAKTDELQAQIEQSHSKLEASKIEQDRAQKLYDIGAVPLKRVQEAQFQVKSNELDLIAVQKQKTYNLGSEPIKRLREAELQIKLNELDLISNQKQMDVILNNQKQLEGQAKTFSLTAPISGIIADVRSSNGSQIEAGKPVISIINLDKVWIEAQVFEKDLNSITSAKNATFKLSAFPNEIFYIDTTGANRLLTIGSSVNPEKRTIPVIYEVANASGKFRDGMFAEITIDTSGDKKVISPYFSQTKFW